MHNLVVALLELAINVDVFDVEAGEMLENFIIGPRFDVLLDNGYNFAFKLRISWRYYLPQLPVRFSQLVRARP